MKRIARLLMCLAVLAGCDGFITPAIVSDPGAAYVWDRNVVPEIIIHITTDEWNRLLNRFDEFNNNVDYFHADFTYKKGSETIQPHGATIPNTVSSTPAQTTGSASRPRLSTAWNRLSISQQTKEAG